MAVDQNLSKHAAWVVSKLLLLEMASTFAVIGFATCNF
jgi:hypothetical protein